MKRILTVQDISCVGKCSGTIALPVLSCMGIETVLLPTALLSTHTMFPGAVKEDLSDLSERIIAHWKAEGITFDAVYTGYLGSCHAVRLARTIIRTFRKKDTLVLVDPVMGDHGKLYRGFDKSYVEENKELCAEADLFLPNITEACYMTGMPYQENGDEEYLKTLLMLLSGFGKGAAALTGVSLQEGKTGVMGISRGRQDLSMLQAESVLPEHRDEGYFVYQNEQVPAAFHGTGDLFASVCAGALLKGMGFRKALALAADYTAYTIRFTMTRQKDPRFGLYFEETLKELMKMLEQKSV